MYGSTPEQALLEAGKGPVLMAAFEAVVDAEIDGVPKFTPRVCRQLARLVTCRGYAPALLEVCHLVTLADACASRAGGYEAFFWGGGPARADVFRAKLAGSTGRSATGPCRVALGQDAAEIAYPDGGFAIAFGRMPLLSAMMEFLVTVIGYGELDRILRDMLASGPTAKAVSAAANALSRDLYAFLKEQLPTAQQHRKFACLVGFLCQREGRDFDLSAIDDEAVLDFWLSESASDHAEGQDFKTFLAVFRGFIRLLDALQQAITHEGLRRPKTIGTDREAGEVDPDAVLTALEAADERCDALARLQAPPAAAIKFLNKGESADLALLAAGGPAALALPLSLLRAESFGTGQSKITQALRRKLAAGGLRRAIETCVTRDYRQCIARLDELDRHIERVLLAGIHVLIRGGRAEALAIALALRPDLDLAPLRPLFAAPEDDGTVIALNGEVFRSRLMAALEDPQHVGAELGALMAEARKAYRGLSRQGFADDGSPTAETLEGFAVAGQALIDLRRLLAACRRKLSAVPLPGGDWARQFEADRTTFHRQFLLLYGVENEPELERPLRGSKAGDDADLHGAVHA